MQKELREQIEFFIKDESYFDKYDNVTPIWDYYLVRIFKFRPKKSNMQTTILVPNASGEWESASQVMDSKMFPLVKIIKLGAKADKDNIRKGDVFTVPAQEILGDTWNPDFLHLVNTFKTPGGKQGSIVNLPDGMRQRIPNIEKYWELDMFVLPENFGKLTEEDRLTYLIPSSKLKAKYELT